MLWSYQYMFGASAETVPKRNVLFSMLTENLDRYSMLSVNTFFVLESLHRTGHLILPDRHRVSVCVTDGRMSVLSTSSSMRLMI